MERLVSAIAATGLDAQMIIVCGRNQRTRERLSGGRLSMPAAVLGFVDDMPELMHAADIVLTKGGPTSIVEAISSGRPMIITQTLPGQEEGNAEYVERHGIGKDGRQIDQAIEAIRRLAREPAERSAMAARARALARLDAARDAAALLLDLAGSYAAQRVPAGEAETA
jgi:UDP-N-acetylglucosamine:LPS N-acetylglucosamine transferase